MIRLLNKYLLIIILVLACSSGSSSPTNPGDNSGGEDQNPSLYMSQETSTAGAYQFLMGLEGTANLSYTGSYTNQPFIITFILIPTNLII